MSSCLYCGGEGSALSEEHVISAAFGCKEVIRGVVCKSCNDTFGHTLEAPLINGLEFFLYGLSIPGRDGNVRKYKCRGTVDGQPVEITYGQDGRVDIPPRLIESSNKAGMREKVYRVYHQGHDERIAQNLRRRHSDLLWERIEGQEKSGQIEAEHSFDARVLCSPETNRAIAKYALNLLAFHFGPSSVRHRFSNLRAFVTSEHDSGLLDVGIVWNQDLLKRIQPHPPLHVLITFVDGRKHVVAVLIYLFSLFPFCLVQQDSGLTIDLFKSSVINPYQGRMNPALATLLLPEERLAEKLVGEPKGTLKQASAAGGHAFRWLDKQINYGRPLRLCYQCARLVDGSAVSCPKCGGNPFPPVDG